VEIREVHTKGQGSLKGNDVNEHATKSPSLIPLVPVTNAYRPSLPFNEPLSLSEELKHG
jgi:hypothetical protein